MQTEKKYLLSIPVGNINFYNFMNREKTVELMKKMEVDRVFLSLESNSLEGEKRTAELTALKANTEFLHNNGFEVGAWFWTFLSNKKGFVMMTSPDYSGNEYGGIAFGEDAKIISEKDISNGLILDYSAAKILSEKGIDTGLRGDSKIVKMEAIEHFSDGEKTGHLQHINIHKTSIAESAELESWTISENKKIPNTF